MTRQAALAGYHLHTLLPQSPYFACHEPKDTSSPLNLPAVRLRLWRHQHPCNTPHQSWALAPHPPNCSPCARYKALELRLWPHQHPLRQMDSALTPELLSKLEVRRLRGGVPVMLVVSGVLGHCSTALDREASGRTGCRTSSS